MSSFLYRLGSACYRHRWRTVAAWLVTLVVLGALAAGLRGAFQDNFTIPGAQSQEAMEQLQMNFTQVSGTSATLLVVAPEGDTVNDPAVRTVIEGRRAELEGLDSVESVTLPWDEHVNGLISQDEAAAIVTLRLPGAAPEITDAEREEVLGGAEALQAALPTGAQVHAGGEAFSAGPPHLSIIEAVGVGLAFVVLLITLGSFVAAGMPLITAVLGVAVTMCLLLISTGVTEINSTTPMLAVMLGLAVGIDYALFILSRHRELLRDGLPVAESAGRAVATAGSAVVFAGATVVIALLGLFVANIPFLTVMGVFAAVGVAIAVVIALTLLPALMGLAGERMRPRRRRSSGQRLDGDGDRPEDDTAADPGEPTPAIPSHSSLATRIARGWVRLATRLPVVTILGVLVIAGALAYPAKDLTLALPNAGSEAPGTPARTSYDLTAEYFGPGYNGPLIVTADIVGSDDPLGVMDGLKADIETMDGVASVPVSTPNRNADTGFVQVVPTTGPDDPQTKDLVQRLRDKADGWQQEYQVATAVTGNTAVQIDVSDRLARALVPFGLLVVGLSLVLLTMVFRSIAVPIKASLGFLLSTGVAFGTTTWVFNEGHLAGLINLAEPGPVISFLPIMLMGILFGLAMDYEVFLVSRMREDYVHGRSAREAITSGFIGSSSVVTAAALIMFAVFAFFVPEGEGPIKSIAFALAVGVAFDAFVVRMTFVPAVMALLGDRAWWLPGWLDRRLPTLDVEGETLYRQLAQSSWPPGEQTWLIYAEDLAVHDLVDPAGAAVGPGQVLVVEGTPATRAAWMLALAGRLRPDSGRARVAGHLVGEQAGQVRRDTAYLDVPASHDAAADLSRLIRRTEPVLFIDGADALASTRDHERLEALLRSLPVSGRAAVLGVAQLDVLHERGLLHDPVVLRVSAPGTADPMDQPSGPHPTTTGRSI
ncbi:MAG: MMPL family transporter [Actinomycetales bacterium]